MGGSFFGRKRDLNRGIPCNDCAPLGKFNLQPALELFLRVVCLAAAGRFGCRCRCGEFEL